MAETRAKLSQWTVRALFADGSVSWHPNDEKAARRVFDETCKFYRTLSAIMAARNEKGEWVVMGEYFHANTQADPNA